ncbi:MAG TPA: hypothetical protein VK974_00675 [Methylophilaceae bacterium]|nr:hypothetical protein [Methylophilaceae bacterium]
MYVVAAKGLKVPKEFNPHDYIEQVITKVPDDSAYYARRITDTDLEETTEDAYKAQQAEIAAAAAEAAAELEKATKKQTKNSTAS